MLREIVAPVGCSIDRVKIVHPVYGGFTIDVLPSGNAAVYHHPSPSECCRLFPDYPPAEGAMQAIADEIARLDAEAAKPSLAVYGPHGVDADGRPVETIDEQVELTQDLRGELSLECIA